MIIGSKNVHYFPLDPDTIHLLPSGSVQLAPADHPGAALFPTVQIAASGSWQDRLMRHVPPGWSLVPGRAQLTQANKQTQQLFLEFLNDQGMSMPDARTVLAQHMSPKQRTYQQALNTEVLVQAVIGPQHQQQLAASRARPLDLAGTIAPPEQPPAYDSLVAAGQPPAYRSLFGNTSGSPKKQ